MTGNTDHPAFVSELVPCHHFVPKLCSPFWPRPSGNHQFLPGCDTAYMYGEIPFMDLCYDPLQCLSWWQARAMNSNADVLSVCHLAFLTFLYVLSAAQILGIKLFSVSPSEMCDERGASKLSAFNSAKRNGLSAENLIHMTQLHDHWTCGLESPMYTHTAPLHLPKPKNYPSPCSNSAGPYG